MIATVTKREIDEIFMLDNNIFKQEGFSKDYLKKLCAGSDSVFLCYKKDDIVVGYIICTYIFENCDLLKIAVMENYRHIGIATELLKSAFDILREKNVKNVMLEVNVYNRSAINFYNKNGFIQIAERRRYYANGDNALVLKRIL